MKWLKLPQNVFLIIALFFGALFQVVTPPFQSPDEFNHFYRAYQIADGNWTPLNIEHRLGGYVPRSFIDIQDIFFSQHYNNVAINLSEIGERNDVALNDSDKVFVDFPNTALYSPASYIPQAIAIFICKKFSVPPLTMFYAARISVFLFWIIFMYLSVTMIPVYKWLMAFLCLTPMSIFISGTLSADIVTNSVSFLTIAFILHCAFIIKEFNYRHLIFLLLLAVMLALSKLIYAGLILLYFIIPAAKFKSKKAYIGFFIIIILCATVSGKLWMDNVMGHYIPYTQYDKNFEQYIELPKGADIVAHKVYIAEHPVYFLKVLINSLLFSTEMYMPSYIGGLGCLEVKLPAWCYFMAYLLIIFLAVFDSRKEFRFSFRQKMILLLTAIILFTLLIYSQHVSWDSIGDSKVDVVQGRYLIPIFPLVFFLFYQTRLRLNKLFIIVPFLMMSLFLFLSYHAIGKRYVSDSKKLVNTIIWNDGKNVSEDKISFGFYGLSNPSDTIPKEVESGYFRSFFNLVDVDTRVKNPLIVSLHNGNKYRCGYNYVGAKRGDLVYAEAERKGSNVRIVYAVDSDPKFFVGTGPAAYRDKNGWEKIRIAYHIGNDYPKSPVKIFLMHASESEKDTSLVRNFKVLISHLY